jgi:hypothetical protein
MMPLTEEQLCSFAERGFVVIPGLVPRDLIEAATKCVDALIEREPPPPDRRGPHFYWRNELAAPDPLLSLVAGGMVRNAAEAMIKPLELLMPTQAQVSLNIPPYDHRPGGPHLDGLTPAEPTGRPGTFSLLAGIFLTDQRSPNMGNLWVWPGSHLVCASYLREHGADALLGMAHPR